MASVVYDVATLSGLDMSPVQADSEARRRQTYTSSSAEPERPRLVRPRPKDTSLITVQFGTMRLMVTTRGGVACGSERHQLACCSQAEHSSVPEQELQRGELDDVEYAGQLKGKQLRAA